ncbi:MAG: hypothetical protein A2V77_15215 [Anaeromyxobacter sp. RBG_16_69_14]|nr:MAG: hypothetical protein A2V77_15215 [Anaeromyxobacter sp. RBG_16_69_14]
MEGGIHGAPHGGLGHLVAELHLLLLERGAVVLAGAEYDLAQVDVLPPQLDPAARDPRDVEEVHGCLGFQRLDAKHRRLLEEHLLGLARDGRLTEDLYRQAETLLRERKVILPGQVRLERFVAGVLVRAEAGVPSPVPDAPG